MVLGSRGAHELACILFPRWAGTRRLSAELEGALCRGGAQEGGAPAEVTQFLRLHPRRTANACMECIVVHKNSRMECIVVHKNSRMSLLRFGTGTRALSEEDIEREREKEERKGKRQRWRGRGSKREIERERGGAQL